MSAIDDLGAGIQRLAAAVRAVADDPGQQLQLLAGLVALQPTDDGGEGSTGAAAASMGAAVAAHCRRAALTAMARAAAQATPASYEDAVAIRDQLCGLLDAEILVAGDTGDDASCDAMRTLRAAVAEDLTRRAANLSRMRTVAVGAPLPALVLAYRLYADLGRSDQLAAAAAATDLNFMPPRFQALER
ncbi:hypothetical protein [Roseomonas sp. USHLN139]|uniref:hypothetical protein n=1 Tax=Roseomonas sp. USHLN139 TaxID=3081298 RepID=UPI003B0123A5